MVVSRRSSTRVAGAEATSASNPLADLEDLYPSADEGDGDRGDQTSVPSGPEGFDMSFPSPPGSPMEADPTTVEFNLGAGSFTPKSSRRSRSSARSGHARGSRRAASPMPTTPPAAAGSESPESPSVADFFNPKQWPPRSGSRPRDGGSEGGERRSATAPEFATYVDKSGATPESFPASKSFGAATPLGEHTAVHGEFSPDLHFRGFGARDAGPFSPFAAAKREEAAPPVDAFADLSFNLGSGGEKNQSRANKSEKSASARRKGVSPRKASQTREAFSSRVETSAFAKNGTSSFSSETDAAETTNAAPFQFTPPPPAASHPTFPTFPTFSDAGLRGAPFAPAAPFGASLFAPGSGNPKPAGGKKTVSGKKTPKKKPSASAPGATFASSATTPPRSPTEVAKDRIPPSIFAAAEVRSSDPASPASGGRRSPLRRASRPQKSASPTPSPPSSPMDILRERVASVNLGRGDAPDSAAAAHRAAAAGAANVSFTFSSASEAGASPFASDATRLKEAGNAAFKAGRYQVATANYDEALERMAREFPTLRVPEALHDDCVAHEQDASLAKKEKGKEHSFVAGGRDAAVCYANRAAARLMNVNAPNARGGAFEKIVAGDDARVSNGSRRAVAAASDVRAALRDCRAALAADPSFRRARLRAGTCLMRLGAFEAARAEFLLAADSGSGSLDAGGTAAEARRLAGDAARAAALVDDLTRVDGGALASLRRHSVDGASVGARRVKTNAFLAAEGNGGTNSDDADDKDASSSSRSVAATARGVLRSVRDISAVAPHCAAVAEAKARALLWEGRFADAAAAADAEGLGGAAHRIKKSGGAKSGDASLADASPRAFCFETGGEAWRARVRFLARFATGDLAGAVEASGVESSGDGFGDDGDIPARDGKAGRGGAEENDETDAKKKNTEASVMNDDASLVASRVAYEIESAEKSIFVSLLRAATEAHALRVQGNASFKAKKYERAAETYTAALEALATAPGGALSAAFCSVCLCNRAAAAHALGRVADALADCGRALALNPARIKSLSRRAQLYAETRMHDAAADDLQRLLATLALGTETKRDAERGGSLSAAARLADAAAGAEDPSSRAFAEFRDGVTARLREARAAARAKTTPDHVAVLGLGLVQARGVSSVALALSDSDVKKAYRRLALKHHPDKSCVGLPGWADAEALRRDADAVFKLVGEAHAALASAEKRREFDAADRKARFANEYASSFGASAPSDFGFSTFARDAARHGSSRRGGSAGGGSASRGGYRRAGGAHGSGGGGSFYGDWFGEENRAAGRGAYRSRRSGGGGYKT